MPSSCEKFRQSNNYISGAYTTLIANHLILPSKGLDALTSAQVSVNDSAL